MDWLVARWADILFSVIAGVTIACSLGVVVTQNIVRAAVWLLFALAGTALIFFFLGADFVGAVQLLIYVGGTLVLVIFGVMLTAQGPFVRMQTRSGEWMTAAVIGGVLFALLAGVLWSARWPEPPGLTEADASASRSSTAMALGLGFLSVVPQGEIHGQALPLRGDPAAVGYLLPFEIVSVHLLVVLIGAAYLARAKRRRSRTA